MDADTANVKMVRRLESRGPVPRIFRFLATPRFSVVLAICLADCLTWHPARLAAQGPAVAEAPEASSSAFTPPLIEVPPGYTVELAAGPPLVTYPMMACFDERGRLFIAESDGQNLGKDELLAQQPRFVRMLEDIDGDGKFDKSTIFADKMVMPEGALWHDGAFFILSAPYLWRLDDSDRDGVADRRTQLVGQMDLIGNANQHGPYLAPDGRLLFSGGTYGYDLVGTDGKHAGKGNWASVFSCWPDGTDVRIECHAGINPVEVAFTAEGEMLGTCAIFDRIGGRHDALVHWVHGATYAEYLKPPTLKQTGRYLPAASLWGQVAPAGLIRYRGTHLGEDYRDSFFACQFNTHNVVRIQLEREGATFRGMDEVFLSSPSVDFHPADVLEDADGSLLIIDTGGWLTMGCPTSKTGGPVVTGAIYRVRKVGAAVESDPRGLKLGWRAATPKKLAAWLDDARPAVRDRAIASLAQRAGAALPALRKVLQPPSSSRLRQNAVWTLARIGTPRARSLLCEALADPDPGVRQAATHSVGDLRDESATTALTKMVIEDELPIRREAATALGLIGKAEAVPALVESLRSTRDQFLEHALIYALIEIADPAQTREGLADPAPHVQRAALIALDQMDRGDLTRADVAPLLASSDHDLQQAALVVIGKNPAWADEIVELLGEWLAALPDSSAHRELIGGAVTAFPQSEKVQAVVATSLDSSTTPQVTLLVLLEAIGRVEIEQLPEAWVQPLSRLLTNPAAEVRRQAVATIAPFNAEPFAAPLLDVARDTDEENSVRVASLEVATRGGIQIGENDLKLLTDQVRADVAPIDRLTAVSALAQAALSAEQLTMLTELVKKAGPLELPALVRAFEIAARTKRVPDSEALELGRGLARALEESPGLATLSAARIQAVLDLYPPEVVKEMKRLLPRLGSDNPEQRALLAELESQAASGDAELGRQVFLSNQAACTTCHRAAGAGGQVGPDLSRIGQVRTARDLAEAILLPSATFTNGFESYLISTHSGLAHNGLIRRETADSIYLLTTDRTEVRIARDQVEEMLPSGVSVMPQGLEKAFTIQQLRDLIAFLVSLK